MDKRLIDFAPLFLKVDKMWIKVDKNKIDTKIYKVIFSNYSNNE